MTERIFFIAKNLFKTYKHPVQERIKTKFKPITNRFGQFVLYSAAFYNWDEQGVSDYEIKNTIQEFVDTSKLFFDQRSKKQLSSGGQDCSLKKKQITKVNQLLKDEWEAIIVKNDYQVWRKKLEKSGLYRYKVFGTFHDIPASTFFNVQMDTEYRKKWDALIVKLNIIDKEKDNGQVDFSSSLNKVNLDTGNEVLQWVMKYPYPMYSREYCYIRRALVCNKENLIVLISKSCDHPKCNEQSNLSAVRVIDYESQMVIKPHSTFDENGFDYLLTYFDDPRAYVPMTAYNWIASSGLPGFVDSLHKAALDLKEQNRLNKSKNQSNKEKKPGSSDDSSSKESSNKKYTNSNYTINQKTSSLNQKNSYSDVVYN